MLFKDQAIHNQYCDEGYVILRLFDLLEIEALKKLYEKNIRHEKKGLHPSLRFRNSLEKITEFNELRAIVDNSLQRHFENYDYVANHFITKTANNPDEFKLHQDWNVTDESQFIAAHIWAPLQVTNEQNGGLFVVKGSHRFFKNYRSGSLGISFIAATENVKPHIISLDIKPGEAVIYNQSLFHGSHPNKSDADRNVVLICIKPNNAPMLIYHKEQVDNVSTRIKAYHISPEMLLEQITELEKGAPPQNAALYSDFTVSNQQVIAIDNSIFESQLQ